MFAHHRHPKAAKLMTATSRNSAGRVLFATSIGYTLVLLDASIVNVGLKPIALDLHGHIAGLQWIVNAYTLVFACLLMTGGTLGDRLGVRNVYIVGQAVFVGASALCSLAPSVVALACARALQGLGSALAVPCSLALISHAYPDPRQRASSISVWMGCGGVAMASGPLIGGLLIHLLGWRSIFWVNVPIGMIGIWLAASIDNPQASTIRRLDWRGQIAAAMALGSLIGVLIEGARLGWSSALIVSGMLVSGMAWIAFLLIEARGRDPMLPLNFFRSRLFAGSTFVSMASAFVFYGLLFTLSLFYQQVRGDTPLQAGLAFLPMTAMVAIGGLCSSRLVARFGGRWSMCGAFGCYAAGALGLLLSSPTSPYWLAIGPLLAVGFASGFISPAATAPALGTVDRQRVGIAAATLNAARQTGAALGVAVFGTFVASAATFQVAMQLTLIVAVCLATFAAMVWWMTSRIAARMDDDAFAPRSV